MSNVIFTEEETGEIEALMRDGLSRQAAEDMVVMSREAEYDQP